MEFKKIHIVGIIVSLLIIGLSFFVFGTRFFLLVIGIGIIIGVSPFIFSILKETRLENEKEQMFLEFARNLVESVKTGTPISKSIINVKNKPYGILSEHVKKLANQIHMGVPLTISLQIFSKDINNQTVSRAITLIGQAEKSGGEIGEILESVAGAVSTSDKLKKERKAAISNLVNQGYIIFFVFIIIVLVMQFRIIPLLSGAGGIGDIGGSVTSVGEGIPVDSGLGNIQAEISNAFLYLILVQGLFTGLVIGKLADGSIKAGVKHSFGLVLLSFVITSIANIFFG